MQNENILNLASRASMPIIILGDIEGRDLQDILKVSAADFFEINESPIRIQQLRDLIHFLNFRPMNSPYKLALIKNADKMAAEASNTILKTLEEPPAYAKIILTTFDEEKILPTIISRCQKIRLPAISEFLKVEDYIDPDKIAKMTLAESFAWANKVSDGENVFTILTLWQDDYRQRLTSGLDVLEKLKEISQAKDLLKTNISVKLLLENLILVIKK